MSPRVVDRRPAVVHFVDPEHLLVPAVAAELVIFAHDQRFHRLGRTYLGAQPAETAPRKVEVEIIEHLDLLSGLAVSAKCNKVVGTDLRALIADNARRRA